MRWSTLGGLAAVVCFLVAACGDDVVRRGDVLVHIDGEVRHTLSVCCDGKDKLGTTIDVSNPTDRRLDLEILPESRRRPLRISPAAMVLEPGTARSVRMDLINIPNFEGGGDPVLIVERDGDQVATFRRVTLDFVLDERMIELELSEPAVDGAPRVRVTNPTPIPAHLVVSSTGKWSPTRTSLDLPANESSIVIMEERNAPGLPTGDEATISIHGTRCSTRSLPEATLIVHR